MPGNQLPGGTLPGRRPRRSPASATAPCSWPAPACSGRRRTATPPSPCCARPSTWASPHRHRRLLRPVRHQRDHPRGARTLPGRPAHRHQGRRPPRRAGRLAARPHPRRAARSRSTTTCDASASTRSTWSTCGSAASTCPEPGSIAEQFAVARRAAAAGPDPAPRAQHRRRRPARRGAVDRPGRVRAELLQPRPPRRRRAGRRTAPAGHRVRAVLPARRLLAAAVRRPGRGRGAAGRPRRWPSRWPGCCSAPRTSC